MANRLRWGVEEISNAAGIAVKDIIGIYYGAAGADTPTDFQILEKTLAPQKLALLNPSLRNDDLCDQKSVFGRDMSQVFLADIVFVDARHRRGLGVGAEMMWAKFHAKPVIVLAPNETHYRKATTEILGMTVNEYVHPFVQNLSDKIVSSVEEGADWLHPVRSRRRAPRPQSVFFIVPPLC